MKTTEYIKNYGEKILDQITDQIIDRHSADLSSSKVKISELDLNLIRFTLSQEHELKHNQSFMILDVMAEVVNDKDYKGPYRLLMAKCPLQ